MNCIQYCKECIKTEKPPHFSAVSTTCNLYCRVGWSDLALFCDFWKLTHFCHQVYFQNLIPKKSAISAEFACRRRGNAIIFKISYRDLEQLYIFYFLLANTSLVLQRTVAKKNIWNTIFFVAPKMDKFDFDLVKGNTIFFSFSSFLVFKQTKKQLSFQVPPLKIKN